MNSDARSILSRSPVSATWSRHGSFMVAPAVLLLILCVSVHAQPRDAPANLQQRDAAPAATSPQAAGDDPSAIVDRWLHSSCVADEERALSDALIRHRGTISRALQQAVVDGPPSDEVRRIREGAEKRYADRTRFEVDAYRIEGVSKEDLARWKHVTEREYAEDQVRRYVTGYRSNAIAGLGIVDGPGARELLERLAADRENPLAAAAEEALKSLRKQ